MIVSTGNIPEELFSKIEIWTSHSFEEHIDAIESWLDYALKKIYTKRWLEIKKETLEKIIKKKVTQENLENYYELMEEEGRDLRYLVPYFLSLYFIAKEKSENLYKRGETVEAFSTTSLMSFCVGILTEKAEEAAAGNPDYVGDPSRRKIASLAAAASHSESIELQRRIKKLILEAPKHHWISRTEAAESIAQTLRAELYTENHHGGEVSYKPRSDLGFKLTLKGISLPERIYKWIGAGREGKRELHEALREKLKPKQKRRKIKNETL